jgi:putative spermidine/putrescine transport system substrate-binding protein
MRRPASGRLRATRVLAPAIAAALILAACGDDDDAADTTAAPATTAAAATTAAPETSAATTESTSGSDATMATTATSEAGTDTTAASGGAGFASMDEITALCPEGERPDKLVFSTFDSHEKLIGPSFADFTAATGIQIEFLSNSLGDRLTKMAAEKGSPTIDLALVPVNEVPALLENGIVEPTDTSIPNYDQLLDVAKIDGGYGTSVLQFGIAYNPQYVTTPPTSWKDLLDPKYAGHIAFPAMPNSGGYAALSMLNRDAGGDDGDLTAGIDAVAAAKSGIVTFYPSSPSIEPQILSGEIWIYPDIGGAALAAQDRGVPVEITIPEEGGPAGLNTVVLPVGSDHLGCTKAFVSYFLGEQVQGAWASALHYGSVSSAFTPPADVEVYPKNNSTIVQLDWPTIAANGPDTLDIWNRQVVG